MKFLKEPMTWLKISAIFAMLELIALALIRLLERPGVDQNPLLYVWAVIFLITVAIFIASAIIAVNGPKDGPEP